ncbi:hypothetical protein DXG03_006575 [Asterophora parasitica]|uniref:40S ribosomal protein S25 n=1 Tax=Asterophora parasitica TaxID=117018 RepID=A0A9P7GAP9_9AGAR|nr:hypothetical protein DXG03_006575 [Asterophora parasitica]
MVSTFCLYLALVESLDVWNDVGRRNGASASNFELDATLPAKAKAPAPSSGGKSAKKKKWSKGKVKDKAVHAVTLDKATFDRIFKEVPTFKFVSQSILIERLKIGGALARVAIQHLEREGHIKRIVHHSSQLIYTRATAQAD